jgi:flagellar biosynthesis/type III secretory pathway M-ring protein FliF/YscJ
MDQLRVALANARGYLGKMTASQKLLLGSLGVIAAMSLFVVSRYAAAPSRETLQFGGDDQYRIVQTLSAAGIPAEDVNGEVTVPKGMTDRAIAVLSERGHLPDDTTILFNNLVTKQDWRNSREQNRQQFVFALQNELGRVISKLKGVRAASVIIDAPEPEGLGRAVRDATASATVWSSTGASLGQDTVDAVAHLVAGARAGLRVENVRVIDGSTGTQRRASEDGQMQATSYLEHATVVENETRRKLETLLAYVPGVTVAVTAQVDVTRVSQQTRRHLPLNEGTVSLLRTEDGLSVTESGGSMGAAEPGVRSMQGADINTASGLAGTSMEQSEDRTEFENAIGTEVSEMVDPRGMPTFLAVSVNVPESYVEGLIRREGATGDAPEGEAQGEQPAISRDQLLSRFDDVQTEIAGSVRPHLKTRGTDGSLVEGEVLVAMVPTATVGPVTPPGGGVLGLLTGPGGAGGVLGGRPVDTLLLASLTMVSLGLMVMMVRKGTKRVELPSAEELVGVPPALHADTDMVGEAEEGESAMTGIEVGDDEMARSKTLEQIGEFVRTDPEKAARLVSRWMAIED